MELNLCTLLNIDVEAIAYRIAMGLDDDDDTQNQPDIQKRNTAVSSHESATNEESNVQVDDLSDSLA